MPKPTVRELLQSILQSVKGLELCTDEELEHYRKDLRRVDQDLEEVLFIIEEPPE